MLADQVEKIIDEVLHEKVQEALQEINSRLPVAEWKSNGTIEKIDGGYNLWFDNELIVYYSYGTGDAARDYLDDKREDFQKDAWLFKKPTDGKTPSHDLIIPQVTRVLLEVDLEVTIRVEEWFKSVKF